MGKHEDAYRKMERAIDDFLDLLGDAVSEGYDDVELDTILDDHYEVNSESLYQQQDSEWLKIAKDADAGKLTKYAKEYDEDA